MGIAVIFAMFALGILALLMIAGPIALPLFVLKELRKRGQKLSVTIGLVLIPILIIVGWPLSGLISLQVNSSKPTIVRSSNEKIGPIQTIFIDGPMFGVDELITVESPDPWVKTKDHFMLRGPSIRPVSIPEGELKSKYMVVIGISDRGSFLQRYLTKSSIKIKERSTGKLVAQLDEKLWGGGLVGHYISLLSGHSPLESRYLSCGYANSKVGGYRFGIERAKHYKKADQWLIAEIFSLLTPVPENLYPNTRMHGKKRLP